MFVKDSEVCDGCVHMSNQKLKLVFISNADSRRRGWEMCEIMEIEPGQDNDHSRAGSCLYSIPVIQVMVRWYFKMQSAGVL